MSFDIPANLERQLEQYAQAENLSPKEAAIKLLSEVLSNKRRKAGRRTAPLTAEDIAAFDLAFPNLSAMDDVTDAQWDAVLRRKRQMDRAGLSARA